MLSVQTNLGGNTALRNLNTNTLNMNTAMNKLSSGFRINSAADDAAGFAVSSKLDGQALRLKAASLNATQAQAMVKMADAGVNQIQNMVNRIQTLAVQASSANNGGELGKLDAERIKLESAINKIAQGTNFNGINLLDGTAKNMTLTTGVASGGTVSQTLAFATSATVTGTAGGSGTALFTEKASFTMTVKAGTGGLASVTSNVALHDTSGKVIAQAGSNLIGNTATGLTFSYTGSTGTAATLAVAAKAAVTGVSLAVAAVAAVPAVAASAAGTLTTTAAGGSAAGTAGSTVANFQVGANNNANDQVGVNLLNSYTTASLGLGKGDLSTQINAQKYVDTAKVALNAVISQRADLGATKNQIGFIQANLATSIEQTTASISAIRDTDMAAQMANFTKNKILSQVGTSMLAQANQAARNVMSLFR